MKIFILVSTLLICFLQHTSAQHNVNPNNRNNNALIVKFKVIPMIVIGTGIFASSGIEYCFKKIHSFSAEVGAYTYSLPEEDFDSATNQYESGRRLHNHSQHVTFQYKYYLNEGKRRTLYFGAYSKFEKIYHVYESGYNSSNERGYTELQTSFGTILGIMLPFSDWPFGLDVHLGPFYKKKNIDKSYLSASQSIISTSEENFNFGIRLGVSCYWVFYRNGKHRICNEKAMAF